jgi:hypothetical protein
MGQTFKPGDKVTKPGYGYRGKVVRLERKHRTDWVVVLWRGRAYAAREYPDSLVLDTAD